VKLVVYGDFNCPYSRLASDRVNRLSAGGLAEVEWRAVQHNADMPKEGLPVEGELESELKEEIEEINTLLRTGESVVLNLPTVRPNTAQACHAYAALAPSERDAWRTRAFDALWTDGRTLGTASERGTNDESEADAWQREWMAFEKRMVPLLVLPDGYISRGLGALKRLADLADG
jgi:predicted DsbA family dithiol-disulfide isomerase